MSDSTGKGLWYAAAKEGKLMRSLIALLLLGLLGFYIAWPAYSGYRIKQALDTSNPDLLAAKIDFESVRSSLVPAVTAEVHKQITTSLKAAGNNSEVVVQIEKQMLPKIIPPALAAIVTPETLLRIYSDGRDFKTVLTEIIREKAQVVGGLGGLLNGVTSGDGQPKGGLGDLLGAAGKALGVDPGKILGGDPAPAPAAPPASAPSGSRGTASFSLANIKRFALNSLASYSIGIAKDPSASEPDVTIDLAYQGGDWKLVGLRPKV